MKERKANSPKNGEDFFSEPISKEEKKKAQPTTGMGVRGGTEKKSLKA